MAKDFRDNFNFLKKSTTFKEEDEKYIDSGFGFKFTNKLRLVKDNGEFNIQKIGIGSNTVYERLIRLHWFSFSMLFILMYVCTNAVFAILFYLVGIEQIQGIQPGTFIDEFLQCFFFSIQTFTTVGYGTMGPIGLQANILSAINAYLGLLLFALATGLFFARFSKAKSYIRFSKHILLAPFNKRHNSIQMRVVNSSNNKMTDMKAEMLYTWVIEEKGKLKRKFEKLELFIDAIYLFPLNWTLVHIIDQSSPLHEKSVEWLQDHNAEIIVIVRGFDDTYSQFITDYRGYDLQKLKEGYRFSSMYQMSVDHTTLDISKINSIEKNPILKK